MVRRVQMFRGWRGAGPAESLLRGLRRGTRHRVPHAAHAAQEPRQDPGQQAASSPARRRSSSPSHVDQPSSTPPDPRTDAVARDRQRTNPTTRTARPAAPTGPRSALARTQSATTKHKPVEYATPKPTTQLPGPLPHQWRPGQQPGTATCPQSPRPSPPAAATANPGPARQSQPQATPATNTPAAQTDPTPRPEPDQTDSSTHLEPQVLRSDLCALVALAAKSWRGEEKDRHQSGAAIAKLYASRRAFAIFRTSTSGSAPTTVTCCSPMWICFVCVTVVEPVAIRVG